jgi:hypothetical protein
LFWGVFVFVCFVVVFGGGGECLLVKVVVFVWLFRGNRFGWCGMVIICGFGGSGGGLCELVCNGFFGVYLFVFVFVFVFFDWFFVVVVVGLGWCV